MESQPSSASFDIAAVHVSLLSSTFLIPTRLIQVQVAEKTFLELRNSASIHPNINFIAVSHSSAAATWKWQAALPPMTNDSQPPSNFKVLVDDEREIFSRWGLGIASFWHVLRPGNLYTLYRLATGEGIKNRPTESGSRWQTSGNFAVDGTGILRWGGPVERADQVPDFEDVVKKLEGKDEKLAKL